MDLAKLTLPVAVAFLSGTVGCTTLLGDFEASSGQSEDAGPDQSAVTSLFDGGAGADRNAATDQDDAAVDGATDAEASVVACTANQEECDGGCVDNDDPSYCGSCRHDCTLLSHVAVTAGCAAGTCTFTTASCASGYAHCSTNPDDGCEVNVTQPANCGSCGNACPATAPLCATMTATAAAADSGFRLLGSYACVPSCVAPTPALCGQQCVDTTSDPNNCDGCSMACPVSANAQATCTAGNCGTVCDQGFHSCMGQCTDDTSPATCGAACSPCAAPASNGAATCSGAPFTCGITCSQGFNLCPGNQCVDFQSDPSNCNACGNACAGATNDLGVGVCTKGACGVQCNGALSLCPDDSCYNFQNDDHNCGSCGHECYGGSGSCLNGSCQPFVLLKGLTNPFGIAADGTRVYFDDNATGVVYSIDPITKTSVTLASVPGSQPWTLTTDGANVYWVTQASGVPGGVYQVPVDASQNAIPLVMNLPGDLWGITVDKANVYYSTAVSVPTPPAHLTYPLASGSPMTYPPNGRLYSVPIGGGSATLLWPAALNPPDGGITSIAYNPSDGFIYFVNFQGTTVNPNNALVRRIKTDGTNESDMYPGGTGSMGLTVSNVAVFVSNYQGATEYLPIGTAGAAAVRDQLGSGSWGWAVDSKWAYWVDSKASAVWEVPADASAAPTSVASTVGTDIRQIAVDARGLYWTSFADGSVWMLAH
jgi:hypothetical protein